MPRNCKKCDSLFDGGSCLACQKARSAAYRANNKDKIKAINAAYSANNKTKAKSMHAAWYTKNKAKAKASNAAYYAENKEKEAARQAAWCAKNPEKRRIYEINRRARKKSGGGKLNQGLSDKLYALQKGKCVCCNQKLGKDFHLDHIVPLARGGKNIDRNIQLLRSTCNMQKNATPPEEFMRERGFLL